MRFLHPALVATRGPIARGSLQSAAIRVIGLAVSFVQAILAARILGAEGYGVASVALSVVQVAATVAVFGFGPLAVRQLARDRAAGRDADVAMFVQTSGRWVIVLAVLVGGAISVAAVSGLVPDSYRAALLVGGALVFPLALLQLQRGIGQGLGRPALAQAPGDLIRPLLFVSFLTLAFAAQWPLSPPIYLGAFGLAAVAALALALPFTLRGTLAPHAAKAARADRVGWRSEAKPFFAMALIGMLLGEINTLLLGWFASPQEAGLFQPVARLVPLMVLPGQIVAVAFAPRVAELWAQNQRARVEAVTRHFTLVTSALSFLIVAVLIAAAPLIMRIFGAEFLPSADLLWIVGIAQLVNVAAGPVGHLLSMTGRAPTALFGQVVALATNLAVGAALIPSYGARGAAIAMAAGLIVWNLMLLVQVWKRLGFDPSLPAAFAQALSAKR